MDDLRKQLFYEKKNGYDLIGTDEHVTAENYCRGYMELLSGHTHQVATGCSLIYGGKTASFTVVTDVTFRELSEKEIEDYISTDEPYDKAGGYGIQGKGSLLIEKIDGDYFNVVGLPVSRLNQEIIKFKGEII